MKVKDMAAGRRRATPLVWVVMAAAMAVVVTDNASRCQALNMNGVMRRAVQAKNWAFTKLSGKWSVIEKQEVGAEEAVEEASDTSKEEPSRQDLELPKEVSDAINDKGKLNEMHEKGKEIINDKGKLNEIAEKGKGMLKQAVEKGTKGFSGREALEKEQKADETKAQQDVGKSEIGIANGEDDDERHEKLEASSNH